MLDRFMPVIAAITAVGLTTIIAMLAYFMSDLHKDVKEVVKGLTGAVRGLEIITTNMEAKGERIKERLELLENKSEVTREARELFSTEYRGTLDWLKLHLEGLQKIVYKEELPKVKDV